MIGSEFLLEDSTYLWKGTKEEGQNSGTKISGGALPGETWTVMRLDLIRIVPRLNSLGSPTSLIQAQQQHVFQTEGQGCH